MAEFRHIKLRAASSNLQGSEGMEGLSSDLLQGGHVDNPRHLLDNPRRRADENVYQGGDEVKISNRARDLGKM